MWDSSALETADQCPFGDGLASGGVVFLEAKDLKFDPPPTPLGEPVTPGLPSVVYLPCVGLQAITQGRGLPSAHHGSGCGLPSISKKETADQFPPGNHTSTDTCISSTTHLCNSLSISADVEGLASLQHSFSVLRGWSGDPYTWDWIQCNDDPTPRVTALQFVAVSSAIARRITATCISSTPTSALPVESRFQKKGGDDDSGDGGSDLPNTIIRDAGKLRRILKMVILPSVVATIGSVICAICGCRRRRRENDAADDRVNFSCGYSCSCFFLSIDCGSSTPFKDEYGIDWVGDDKYVQNGESRSVKPSNSFNHVADTLRVFTTRNKNCYHIDSVKKGRVLVRASFFYGNYDGKSSPPTFALHFDGNEWTTNVKTSNTVSYYYEVIYVMKEDSISVCVSQTKSGQFPFISTVAVRSLEPFMYNNRVDGSYPLFLWTRVGFGSNITIRYKDDFYDRIWPPGYFGNGSIGVSSDALYSKVTSASDRPPPAVLKTAITATRPNASIELLMGFPSYQMQVYINLYFSEVTQLQPNQNRSFRIFMDNKSSDPILPLYDDCNEIHISNITVSSKTKFSLVPTNFSTLPPLINAMEILEIGDYPLTDGTNKKDVEGLASLQSSFSVLKGWSGDPCLPSPYTWDWINCNDDPVPRVTALFLSGYGLSGLLPDFSSMDALQTIDLHNNSLRGPIPDFLGTFPNLKTLNVANNQLNGTIPASLSTKKGLFLTVAGNPGLCTSNTSCQILEIAPPPVNSSIKKKKANILELMLLAAMILSMIIL
ncbi:hypothetical protein C2S51_024214 [Perilla frutescens var. frutescens]|nr:hypothetical protein C2S51_024214 [Perilla frutescens var. frutescens]